MTRPLFFLASLALSMACLSLGVQAQEQSEQQGGSEPRGSLVEDRAARKLLEAGDARYEAEEIKEALDVWKSVIERYPRSRVRFQAHMRLGTHYLERERAYDQARPYFEAVMVEENRDDEQKAESTLNVGICFYESGNYGKCFQLMREVIEKYPVSPQVNRAYHYIGLGHFQLGHYSRAIEALEKVGTALDGQEDEADKVEAGKRLFIKIEDADLAALQPGEVVQVRCEAASGDVETVVCHPVGRNVRVVLGTIVTRLGKPSPGNGVLEVRGDDQVRVTYVDQHTSDMQVDQPVIREVRVVGNAKVTISDGAYQESLRGVVLGKPVNIQIVDADRDVSDQADTLAARVEIYRPKSNEEVEAEIADLIAQGSEEQGTLDPEEAAAQVDRYKHIDGVELTLHEVAVASEEPEDSQLPAAESEPPQPNGSSASEDAASEDAASEDAASEDAANEELAEAEQDDGAIHSGVFRGTVLLVRSEEADESDQVLQAQPGDVLRVTYLDELHTGEGIRQVQAEARCVEGDLGSPRVTRAVIRDEELRLQTSLKTAAALTQIGNRYKEFGLRDRADEKYAEALGVCDGIMSEASKLGGRILEETYVQLWRIYFQMEQLNLAAAMAQRLQQEFPTSGFVDEALVQLGNVARKQGELQRAISIYSHVLSLKNSQLRGEAQFGIAECYEQMAQQAAGANAVPLRDRAFQEYKKVFDQFPDSGRVGEAVAKMANHYYQQQDYARAIDTFEDVLNQHQDARFLDVVLFNYGRCLYRMGRNAEARVKFDQLIGDYPQSPLAGDAKQISDALRKTGV